MAVVVACRRFRLAISHGLRETPLTASTSGRSLKGMSLASLGLSSFDAGMASLGATHVSIDGSMSSFDNSMGDAVERLRERFRERAGAAASKDPTSSTLDRKSSAGRRVLSSFLDGDDEDDDDDGGGGGGGGDSGDSLSGSGGEGRPANEPAPPVSFVTRGRSARVLLTKSTADQRMVHSFLDGDDDDDNDDDDE